MKVFVSWSGDDSRQVAELFKKWLPKVIQGTEVWVSSRDIGKGARWPQTIWENLADHSFGVLMLTKTNHRAPWVLFEAGALSKTVKATVIPVLCNLDTDDLGHDTPLTQFQNAKINLEDFKSLVVAVNAAAERPLEPTLLDDTFARWWPDFEERFQSINFEVSNVTEPAANATEGNQNLLIAGMGPDCYKEVDAAGELILFCNPNFHNYGSNPAFVRYLEWNFCSDPPPDEPDWVACEQNRAPIENWTNTSQEPKPIEAKPFHKITTPTIIFYGRLVYRDIDKNIRHSGFIYRWYRDDRPGHSRHDRLGGKFPAYVDWR